jgi:plastocyanin
MSRGPSIAIAATVLVFAAGCGSSSGGPTYTNSSPSASTAPASSQVNGGGELRPNTTPKYAVPSPTTPVQSGVVQIAYRNIAIAPDALRVKVGSTIKWTNHDAVEHNVTSQGGPESFASKTFGEGHTFEIKVAKPGVIHYECTIHPASMNGTIEVVK